VISVNEVYNAGSRRPAVAFWYIEIQSLSLRSISCLYTFVITVDVAVVEDDMCLSVRAGSDKLKRSYVTTN